MTRQTRSVFLVIHADGRCSMNLLLDTHIAIWALNDPFDRLLLAQAKVENLSFITHDSLIPAYGEKCIIPV